MGNRIRQLGVALGMAAALASPAALAGGGHIYIGGGDRHLQYGISVPLEGYGHYHGPRYYGYPDRRHYGRTYYDGYYRDRPWRYRRPAAHEHCYRDHGYVRCYRHYNR